MSHDRICTLNVSVVPINGNTIAVGPPTRFPIDALFRGTNLELTSSYGRCCTVMIVFIRLELCCTRHDWGPLQRFNLSYDRICNFMVSVF